MRVFIGSGTGQSLDKVGNRTSLSIEAVDATTEISVDWTYEYNTLNQLKKRYDGASWSGADGDARGSYEYDANGNLTQAIKEVRESGSWSEKLQWEYDWNPRNRMSGLLGIRD
ncbi:MAG: hypothetical protein H6751_14425 [Candidatus Omnitrophica bacterium]|nr:hypothetical protein [Candidatus Omnitrophota bacterium]